MASTQSTEKTPQHVARRKRSPLPNHAADKKKSRQRFNKSAFDHDMPHVKHIKVNFALPLSPDTAVASSDMNDTESATSDSTDFYQEMLLDESANQTTAPNSSGAVPTPADMQLLAAASANAYAYPDMLALPSPPTLDDVDFELSAAVSMAESATPLDIKVPTIFQVEEEQQQAPLTPIDQETQDLMSELIMLSPEPEDRPEGWSWEQDDMTSPENMDLEELDMVFLAGHDRKVDAGRQAEMSRQADISRQVESARSVPLVDVPRRPLTVPSAEPPRKQLDTEHKHVARPLTPPASPPSDCDTESSTTPSTTPTPTQSAASLLLPPRGSLRGRSVSGREINLIKTRSRAPTRPNRRRPSKVAAARS